MKWNIGSIFNKPVFDLEVIDTKASRASALINEDTNTSSNLFIQPGGSDIVDYRVEPSEIQLRKYPNSIWLHVGVSRIVEGFSQIDFRLVDKKKEGEANNDVKGRIATKLLNLLANPNPWMNQNEFKEAVALHLILTGNAYIEKVGKGQNISELYVLNPKNMTVVPDTKNFVKGYRYIVNGKEVKFKPEEIIHIKYFDPRGESRYGLSKIAAARSAIQADWHAVDWNSAYFKNATWPSGIIVCKEGINQEEFKRIRKELKENYEGRSKVGKVMIMSGGLEWKQTTPNPKDLDFAALRRQNREEILALLGVPPTIAGIYEFENTSSRSAGIREQIVFFWSNTIMPLSSKVLDKLNTELVQAFAENWMLVPDASNIPALSDTDEMKFKRAETYKILVRNGWPLEEALKEVYPKKKPFKSTEIAFMEGTLTVINVDGSIAEPPEDPNKPDPNELDINDPKNPPPTNTPPQEGKPVK